ARSKSARIDCNVHLTSLAAGNRYRCNSRKPSEPRLHHVCREVPKTRWIATIRNKAVAGNRKNGERESFDAAYRRAGRQARGHLRQSFLNHLQRLEDVDFPIEKDADVAAASLSG